MKVNPRFVLFLAAALFILSLAFVPGETSASDPKENKDRSASTKPESKSREGKADSESARERNNQRKPTGAPPSSREKPGALKRIASFFKDLFVPRSNKATRAGEEQDIEGDDPDRPKFLRGNFDEAEYVRLREAHIALLRGVEPGKPFDITARSRAINQMDRQMAELTKAAEQSKGTPHPLAFPTWVELGPNPIPNGQTMTTTTAVSGRVTAIEVDPADASKVYVGTAQGGVFRSLDGGATWTPIFDSALSLAIGALALDAAGGRLYVGTGEANGSADSFGGVGLYRIDSVNTTATLVGPINPVRSYIAADGVTPVMNPVFNGRSISKILIVPSDPTTLFVGVAGGVMGIGGDAPFGGSIPMLGMRGLYRLTSVTGAPASVGVTRIGVRSGSGLPDGCFDTPCTGNRNINDMVFDPGDATGSTLIVWLNGTSTAGDGGVWRSTTAMAATPTFTQSFATTATSTSAGRGSLAIYKEGGSPAVVYAASGEPSSGTLCTVAAQAGALRRSIDGGVTFGAKLSGGGGFCGGQCFYNIGLAVLPGATTATTDDKILLGGNVEGSGATALCQRLEGTSTDGADTSFTNTDVGLHADTHVIKIAPSSALTVYRGDDGGIFKSTDGGATWTSLNNSTFKATQFMSIAVHPTDLNFSIGGTQDNGTNNLLTSGTAWTRIDFGDGGFALIDQNATDLVTVTMYHTYFNTKTSLVGFAEVGTVAGAVDGGWTFFGCGGTANGISCSDDVNFYAPMALGPGSPTNTVYYGSDHLYRSPDKGVTATSVSGATALVPGVPISSIAISPLDDTYRMVGLNSGALFYTTTGSSTLTSLDPVGGGSVIPDKYVGRVFFDPTDKKIAYVCLGGFAGGTTAALSHVWRITSLDTVPVLTAINGSGITGLPDVPVNAFVVDPMKATRLFAGTDIGVFVSENSGGAWSPFGTGLPRVAVFGMAIQNVKRVLRIATHGRGMWEIPLVAPTAANGDIGGTITDASGAPVSGVTINLSGTQSRETITDSRGNYSFDGVETNGFYTVTPSLVNYTFSPANRSFSLLGVHTEASFTAAANGAHANAIDTTEFFVRQHYLDFLGREPDPPGFIGWVNTIRNCAAGDTNCDRTHVSEMFYRSQEFQERGYFAYRFYATAFGRKPDYAEFVPDLARVSGFLTNDQLAAAKTAFVDDFMTRPAFASQYNSLSDPAFVDQLAQTAGVSLSNRQALIDALNRKTLTRAQVLRQIAESGEVYQKYYNQAFVVMEYFGYLRRDPDALYTNWISVLDANPADSRHMVEGFVNSSEYRNRFAQ
jgi:hypothetical protein